MADKCEKNIRKILFEVKDNKRNSVFEVLGEIEYLLKSRRQAMICEVICLVRDKIVSPGEGVEDIISLNKRYPP